MPNTYSNLLYHIVFGTKNRERKIQTEWKDELYSYIGGIARNEGALLLAAGGIEDHAHLLVRVKPTIAIATLVGTIKSNSSRWVTDEQRQPDFAWQDGYGAFTVSQSQVETVRNYIARQVEHHRTQSFADEFRALLDRHGIDYDHQYLP